jgi:hypothetical protein
MSNRIEQLAEQCIIVKHDSTGVSYEAGFDRKKFAELIVKECSKINDQFVGRRIGEIDLDIVYKEHFGVKNV